MILTSLYRDHAWVLVNTGHRAIKLLNAYYFDLISLDYNLRGDLTGAAVARAIALSPNADTKVIVHSLNPRGAQAILQVLPNAIYYPISKLVRSNARFKSIRQNLNQFGTSYDWQ